jgi:hypothetical protein
LEVLGVRFGPAISTAISMTLDPAPRIQLEPLQPYSRVAGFEQAELEITDTTTQLAFARHTHVLSKLAA